jgi:PAS domain S-box-containing protein
MYIPERALLLEEYEVLDSLPEREFDDIVQLASALYGVPISAISLLDLHRQWFKAQVGLDACETPIEQSFCRYAVNEPDKVMVVNDSLLDDRFRDNPLVTGDPSIRFYAGAPLIAPNGVTLGALCVIDSEPRQFTEQEQRMLQVLAKKVMKLLQLRKENLSQKKLIYSTTEKLDNTLDLLLEAQKAARMGNWEWNTKTNVMYWSPQIYELVGSTRKADTINDTASWEEFMHPDDRIAMRQLVDKLMIDHVPASLEFRILNDNKEKYLLAKADVEVDTDGEVVRAFGILQDITDSKQTARDRELYIEVLEGMLFDVSHKIRKPLTTMIGLFPMIKEQETVKEEVRQVKEFFEAAMIDLETYTREFNSKLQKTKVGIEDQFTITEAA